MAFGDHTEFSMRGAVPSCSVSFFLVKDSGVTVAKVMGLSAVGNTGQITYHLIGQSTLSVPGCPLAGSEHDQALFALTLGPGVVCLGIHTLYVIDTLFGMLR